MTSKCSYSEQCQFSIFFVAGYILEGSLKMHFPSQTSFLHSGWFLALAANAPNLWCQFYFRFYFCQQCCVLEFDFAPHSKQICRLPFPTLSPLGLPRTEGCLNIVLSHSCGLLCMTHHRTVGMMGCTSSSATCCHAFLCACFHTGGFLVGCVADLLFCFVFFLSCVQRQQLEKAFFFYE